MYKEKELSYDDVSLIPRIISTVESRSDIEPKVKFCGIDIYPIIASPMPDVCNGEMAGKLYMAGSYGFIHRFNTIEEQASEYLTAVKIAKEKFIFNHNDDYLSCGCALGLKDYKDRIWPLYNEGCRSFLIDTANGANKQVESCISYIKEFYSEDKIYITVGNVCSIECFKWLSDLGVDYIRVGMSGGLGCTTRIETAVYRPMFSTLKEVWENNTSTTKIIADGGIKIPADFIKALIYSDIVMCGGIFACSSDSPAETYRIDGKLKKIFRGAASYSTQINHKGKRPDYVEGSERLLDIGPNVESVVKRFINGLRSAMSYFNSTSLPEFRNNVNWCVI